MISILVSNVFEWRTFWLAEKVVTKRETAGPRPAYVLENVKAETVTPIP
jgi:hypothetical protein